MCNSMCFSVEQTLKGGKTPLDIIYKVHCGLDCCGETKQAEHCLLRPFSGPPRTSGWTVEEGSVLKTRGSCQRLGLPTGEDSLWSLKRS